MPLTTGVTGTLPVANGGTGNTTYTNGQLLIGNAAGGLTKATLTAGTGVTITNGDGTVITSTDYTTVPRNETPWYEIRLRRFSDYVWEYEDEPEDAIHGALEYSIRDNIDLWEDAKHIRAGWSLASNTKLETENLRCAARSTSRSRSTRGRQGRGAMPATGCRSAAPAGKR